MQYKTFDIAVIQKIATPMKPKWKDGKIQGAFYSEKSTVDFLGAFRGGQAVCFDAKETKEDRFPLSNIEVHQLVFMDNFKKVGGISFFLIEFVDHNRFFRLDYKKANELYCLWQANKGKRGYASITLGDIQKMATEVYIGKNKIALDYLNGYIK